MIDALIEWANLYCIEIVFIVFLGLPIGGMILAGLYFGIADKVNRRRRRREPFRMKPGEYEDLNRNRAKR